jgi:hypothetical protein
MDEIQKELIKAGRKDLAQEYYKKVAQPQLNWATISAKAEDLSIEVENFVEFCQGGIHQAPYEVQTAQLKEKLEELKRVIRNRIEDIEKGIH